MNKITDTPPFPLKTHYIPKLPHPLDLHPFHDHVLSITLM